MKRMLKSIYNVIPFKKQLFSILRPFNPSEKVYQHLHFKGVFTVKADDYSFKINHFGYPVENSLFWKGLHGFEGASLNLWKELSKTSNTIIDIGANTGVFSLVAGAVNPKAKIIAFEPMPENYNKLQSNVSINNFNIRALQVAIGDKNAEVSFYVSGEYDSSLNASHRRGAKEIKVEGKTLDSFISDNQLIPDLVKMDVERYEPEVIAGFLQGITTHHPTMLVEVLDEGIAARLSDLLKDSQYLFFGINENSGQLTHMERLQRPDGFNVLICRREVAENLKLTSS